MASYLKSAVYTRTFLMVTASDHLSPLTGGSPTVNIAKAGGSFSAAAGTVTEIANGWYKVALTTADTGTAGDLTFHVTVASGDATDFVDQVIDLGVANVGVNIVTYTGNVPQTGDVYSLFTGANTELTTVPASTAALVSMIKWVYLLARNKLTQTSTTQVIKANDGSTNVSSSTVSDDGTTATRGAFF